MKSFLLFIAICLFSVTALFSQESVSELADHYSGTTSWDASTGTITFTGTGTINFPSKKGDGTDKRNHLKQNFWLVPTNVKHIIIDANVTVTGAFHFNGTCVVEGKNRKTSVVFGTNKAGWTEGGNEFGTDPDEWYYCQFQNEAKGGTLTIKNLTSLNPFAYHIRAWNVKATVLNCDFIDNRGGHSNHSDGFTGGDGSLVDNCYFETGDDIFKVYFDYTVSNCTIKMIQNTVPIQLGWGSYSNGSIGTFKKLTIYGSSGRGADENAIIAASYNGSYTVTVNMDSCDIQNTNASWLSMRGTTKVKGDVTNSNIKLGRFWCTKRNTGSSEMVICETQTGAGTTETNFNCLSGNEPVNEYIKYEAENYNECSDSLKKSEWCVGHVGGINDKAWIKFNQVDFGEGSAEFIVNATAGYERPGSSLEIRLDNVNGVLAGVVQIPNTGGWCNYQEFTGKLSGASGVHDVYLLAKVEESQAEKNDIFDIDWIKFEQKSTVTGSRGFNDLNFKVYPNPVIDILNIILDEFYNKIFVSVYNLQGSLVYSGQHRGNEISISAKEIQLKGLCFVKVEVNNRTIVKKIVVK